MLSSWAAAIALVVGAGPGPGDAASRSERPAGSAASDQVRSSLRAANLPWYDPAGDAIRPVKLRTPLVPDLPRGSTSAPWNWGDYLVFGAFLIALVVLGLLIYRYWDRFDTGGDAVGELPARGPATVQQGTILPAALRGVVTTDDPWAEANRRRLAGDLAGATVCLFAHQLLSLARLGLVRLGPGRTARQLHRAVADREFQELVLPTLRQFEAVYYGHKVPLAADFDALWAAAEAFQRRAAAQGAG